MPELRLIDSHDLVLSPLNPRTATPSDAEVAALAGSIEELGLLQNLIGLDRPGGDAVEIVGGGLRLRALLTLPSQEVEVLVYDDADAAVAAALAENEVRREMGPVDRFQAFLGLRAAGRSEAAIARAYATDTAEVARILALRACAPEVLEALGGRRITLDQARAFTVTRDLARQVRLLEQVGPNWHPDAIRRELRAREDAADVLRAIDFVGLEAYEAAGGAVIRDLFSSKVYVEDHALLYRLRDEHLQAAADAELARGWSWAIVGPRPEGMGLMAPGKSAGALSDDEYDRLADLEEADDLAGLDAEGRAELEGLHERAQRDADGVWSADQYAVGGVAVSVGYGGELVRADGLVRPEDEARAVEIGALPARPVKGAAAAPAEEEPAGLPASLVTDLRGGRTVMLQRAVARQPELALDLLAWHLAGGSGGIVNASIRRGETADGATLMGLAPPPTPEGRGAIGFTAFRALGKRHRNALLAAEIAGAIGMGWGTAGQAETAAITAAAGVDVRKDWTPGEALFKRLKVGQLEALFVELTGHPVRTILLKYTKLDVVALLAEGFADPVALAATLQRNGATPPVDLAARIAAWLPEPLRPPAEAAADQGAQDRAA